MKKILYTLGIVASIVLIPLSANALSVGWDRFVIGGVRTLYPNDHVLVGATATTTNSALETTSFTIATSTSGCAQLSSTGIVYSTGTNCGSGSSDWKVVTGLYNAPVITSTTSLPFYVPNQGTSTIANFGSQLDCSAFSGADIYAKCNTAYAYGVAHQYKNVTLRIPNGDYKNVTTNFVCGTNGFRCLLLGDPAGGTTIEWTGTGTSTTINSGVQAVGVDHTSGCGMANITIAGNNYATSSSPQIGVENGGSNGSDCSTFTNVNIQHVGYGLWLSANSYHVRWDSGVLRDNGQNLHFSAANNSGEDFQAVNPMWVDGANHDAFDCIWFDNSATENTLITGGMIDDCQVTIKQANNYTEVGVSHENAGFSAWVPTTYFQIDNNLATNVSLNGDTFFNDGGATQSISPFISNGGNLTLNGLIVRQFGGTTLANLVTLTGSGRVTWNGLNNVSNTAFSNVVTGITYSTVGTTGSSTFSGVIRFPSITDGCLNLVGGIVGSTGSSCASGSGTVTSVGLSLPSEFTITNSPVTTSGTLTATETFASNAILTANATGNGIIATTSQLTVGSILATTTNSSYFGGELNIGTTTNTVGTKLLVVTGTEGTNGLQIVNGKTGGSGGGGGIQDHTGITPTASGDRLGFMLFGFTDGTTNRNSAGIQAFADQSWTAGTNQGSYMTLATTPNNSSTRTEVMRLTSNGTVGIGTTTPSQIANLTLATTTTSQLALSAGANINQWTFRNAGGDLFFSTTTVVGTATTSTAALTLKGTGVPGLSISSSTPNATLTVESRAGNFNNEFFVGSSSELFLINNAGQVFAPNTASSGSSQTGYWCYDGAGQLIRDTTVCLVSARKFKKDIQPLDVGLQDLLKLRPVSYYNINPAFGTNRNMGFIADEVASSSPKLNEMLVAYDSTGAVHGFNYEQFTSLITKSIQDFYKEFQSLIARVSGLEKKLNTQQKEIDNLQAQINALKK